MLITIEFKPPLLEGGQRPTFIAETNGFSWLAGTQLCVFLIPTGVEYFDVVYIKKLDISYDSSK